ncbi:unnamed protein product [Calypogeia fissa]
MARESKTVLLFRSSRHDDVVEVSGPAKRGTIVCGLAAGKARQAEMQNGKGGVGWGQTEAANGRKVDPSGVCLGSTIATYGCRSLISACYWATNLTLSIGRFPKGKLIPDY